MTTEYLVWRHGIHAVNQPAIAVMPVALVRAADEEDACAIAGREVSVLRGQYLTAEPWETALLRPDNFVDPSAGGAPVCLECLVATEGWEAVDTHARVGHPSRCRSCEELIRKTIDDAHRPPWMRHDAGEYIAAAY